MIKVSEAQTADRLIMSCEHISLELGILTPVDLKPLKILLQKLDILIMSWLATCTPIFMRIGPAVSATQIAEI